MRERVKCSLLTALPTVSAFFFMAAYIRVLAGAMFFVKAMRLLLLLLGGRNLPCVPEGACPALFLSPKVNAELTNSPHFTKSRREARKGLRGLKDMKGGKKNADK